MFPSDFDNYDQLLNDLVCVLCTRSLTIRCCLPFRFESQSWWIQCAYSFSKSTEEFLNMLTISNRITQHDSRPGFSNYNQTTPSRWLPLPVYRYHTKITWIQRRCSPSRFPVFRTWIFSVNRKSTELTPKLNG